jgi:hypothetical protein
MGHGGSVSGFWMLDAGFPVMMPYTPPLMGIRQGRIRCGEQRHDYKNLLPELLACRRLHR